MWLTRFFRRRSPPLYYFLYLSSDKIRQLSEQSDGPRVTEITTSTGRSRGLVAELKQLAIAQIQVGWGEDARSTQVALPTDVTLLQRFLKSSVSKGISSAPISSLENAGGLRLPLLTMHGSFTCLELRETHAILGADFGQVFIRCVCSLQNFAGAKFEQGKFVASSSTYLFFSGRQPLNLTVMAMPLHYSDSVLDVSPVFLALDFPPGPYA